MYNFIHLRPWPTANSAIQTLAKAIIRSDMSGVIGAGKRACIAKDFAGIVSLPSRTAMKSPLVPRATAKTAAQIIRVAPTIAVRGLEFALDQCWPANRCQHGGRL